MKLLFITQIADSEDTFLGFVPTWITAFAKAFDGTTVICLKEGKHDLPGINVHSLGKESGTSRLERVRRLFNYIWRLRHDYDVVFIHQNQEYALVAGVLWKLLGKKVYLWRNHHMGSVLTRVAGIFCTKVFYTSRYSYTANFHNAVMMPVGIDTSLFSESKTSIDDTPYSESTHQHILFAGRIAPIKRHDAFIEALGALGRRGVSFKASIYGDALPSDAEYLVGLHELAASEGVDKNIEFHHGVAYLDMPDVFRRHGMYVNLSTDGMYDKTIFEAMAAGSLVLASNKNLEGEIDERCVLGSREPAEIAARLETLLALSGDERARLISRLRAYVVLNHSLESLVSAFVEVVS